MSQNESSYSKSEEESTYLKSPNRKIYFKFLVSAPKDLIDELDEYVGKSIMFGNRAEAVRYAINLLLNSPIPVRSANPGASKDPPDQSNEDSLPRPRTIIG